MALDELQIMMRETLKEASVSDMAFIKALSNEIALREKLQSDENIENGD